MNAIRKRNNKLPPERNVQRNPRTYSTGFVEHFDRPLLIPWAISAVLLDNLEDYGPYRYHNKRNWVTCEKVIAATPVNQRSVRSDTLWIVS